MLEHVVITHNRISTSSQISETEQRTSGASYHGFCVPCITNVVAAVFLGSQPRRVYVPVLVIRSPLPTYFSAGWSLLG